MPSQSAALFSSKHVQAVRGGSGNDIGLWVPGQVEHLGAQILMQHILGRVVCGPSSPVVRS